MQTITLVETLEAIRKHTEAGTLGALAGEKLCKYDYGNGHRCAIGAVMTDETLKDIAEKEFNTTTVANLNSYGVIECNYNELDTIRWLQSKHDDWAEADDGEYREQCKVDFYTYVNQKCESVGLPTMG